MTDDTRQRLFGTRHAFDSPFVLWATVAVGAALVVAPLVTVALARAGLIDRPTRDDILVRCKSWLLIAPLMLGPILLGAFYVVGAVGLLSLLCYREFARATGLFRERAVSAVIALGIGLTTFAALDNWYAFFVALWPLTVAAICVGGVLRDRPKGYVQRVGLGVLAYMLFGACLGHLAYFANSPLYRPILVWLILCTEANDIFAYCSGKTLGRVPPFRGRKLAPNTSPNKTLGGAVGATILTTALAGFLAAIIFRGTDLHGWWRYALLGLTIAVVGQFGDLLLSSVKRDVGVKDMAGTFPGHGGLLDRFDSLLLVAPAVFHFVGWYLGVGNLGEIHIFTGG